MVCRCRPPAVWESRRGGCCRRLHRARTLFRAAERRREDLRAAAGCKRVLRNCSAVERRRRCLARGVCRTMRAKEKRGSQLPRRIYLVGRNGCGAVCCTPSKGDCFVPCATGLARFRYNCATCHAVGFDAEWAPCRPPTAGVALLQLSFWPSCEVFVLRLNGESSCDSAGHNGFARNGWSGRGRGWNAASEPAPPPACPPRGLRRLLGRCARGEALLAGFAIHQDTRRLDQHGLSLRDSGAVDIQMHCSGEERRQLGQPISLAAAAYKLLGEYLDKGPRMSNWEGRLTSAQLRYAAMDAWTTLRLLGQVGLPPAQPGRTGGTAHV
eukprot:TRINITY_DN43618_c0_g1_i1.p1 TRINITY_DN43618_c0_g1~~TRINITY_DN43618_c0_g1_i1.p1  ORF type:complete len:339 (+),score=29.93 TRINITY_DN43618_c0_g1_i1:43-1017(+)